MTNDAPAITAAIDQLHAQITDRALTDLTDALKAQRLKLTDDQRDFAELGIQVGINAVMATIKANGWTIEVAR